MDAPAIHGWYALPKMININVSISCFLAFAIFAIAVLLFESRLTIKSQRTTYLTENITFLEFSMTFSSEFKFFALHFFGRKASSS